MIDVLAWVGRPKRSLQVVFVWPFGRLCAAAAELGRTRLPVPHAQLWRQPHPIAAARCARLRETAPCPTSDDVGHVHASLWIGAGDRADMPNARFQTRTY
eukprot:scaffold687_cov119-Isochrysis_galbana.AAC.6